MSAYKKITSHGSVSIPVQVRRELGLQPKDAVELEIEKGEIRIRPYRMRCQFCGSNDMVQELYGKGICASCARKAYEVLVGEIGGAFDE